MSGRYRPIALSLCFGLVAVSAGAADLRGWIPARWDGGPLELIRRAKDKAPVAEVRDAIANWYSPTTLALLDGSPLNCLLVTFSIGAEPEVEARQHQLVREYTRAARKRGVAVLGVVYANVSTVAADALDAELDGIVLDGDFPAGFAERLETTMRAKHSGIPVIPIWRDATLTRTVQAPVVAIEGVRPSARNLADMGIRAGPSAEPWIESNIWLIRAFRLSPEWRPIWINQQPNPSSMGDYVRCVADAAVAGGRWIVAPDDELRSGLFRRQPDALATWKSIAGYLKFAEEHAEWRRFMAYGNVGIIVDAGGKNSEISNEYLNLVARRHVPYRLIARPELCPESLAKFRAVLAADLESPTDKERGYLRGFAEKGGFVVAGPWWGTPRKDDLLAEIPIGKGRVAVYKGDPPDPEMVAKDLLELLDPEVLGLRVFNVPSSISYVSIGGGRVLIQLLNYASVPSERVTIRFQGNFKAARFYAPEHAPIDLPVRAIENNRTELLIPKLVAWGAVLLE